MLLTGIAAAVAMMAQAVPTAGSADVAYDSLAQGRNFEVVAAISTDEAMRADDPAQLINLGIAHARIGNEGEARELFKAAITSEHRTELETANGEWKDSTYLARKALRMLENGAFRADRVTMR